MWSTTFPPNHQRPLSGNKLEPARRLFHASGLFLLLIPYFWGPKAGPIFLGLALGVTLFDLWRRRVGRGQRLSQRFLSQLLRPSEYHRPAGTVYFFWGVALSFLFFGPHCGSVALVVLSLADPLAGLMGNLCPRPTFLRKTLSGTLCFAWVASAIFYALAHCLWSQALLLGILSALLENLSPVDDNLSVPLGVGLLCKLVL